MITSIILPTDGSEVSERAFPYAVRLALAAQAPIVLVTATGKPPGNPQDNEAYQSLVTDARTILDRAARDLGELNLRIDARLIEDEPVDAILSLADEGSLVVMSTHGRGGFGKFIFGSTTEAVIQQSRVPLLISPAHSASAWRTDRPLRMLVPLDGSDIATAILPTAQEVARTLGASMSLLGVVERSRAALLALSAGIASPGYIPEDLDTQPAEELGRYLRSVADSLTAEGPINVYTVRGFPAETIAATARSDEYDLIAMSTRGRSGLARALMGSVTAGVLQLSPVPVLIRRAETAD